MKTIEYQQSRYRITEIDKTNVEVSQLPNPENFPPAQFERIAATSLIQAVYRLLTFFRNSYWRTINQVEYFKTFGIKTVDQDLVSSAIVVFANDYASKDITGEGIEIGYSQFARKIIDNENTNLEFETLKALFEQDYVEKIKEILGQETLTSIGDRQRGIAKRNGEVKK